MGKALLIWLFSCCSLAAQWYSPPPQPTALPSQPFFIRNIWYVGGTGPWDTMTMDPSAGRLYIAHGRVVQVVDVSSGTVGGEIKGLAGAYAIALDDKGMNGYISDGQASRVVVFDRHSLQTVADIATQPNPRSLVYEPVTGLVFVVQSAPPAQPEAAENGRTRQRQQAGPKANPESYITVIDPQSDKVLGLILVSGSLGYAQADGAGQVYVGCTDGDAILRFNAQAVAAELHGGGAGPTNPPATGARPADASKSAAAGPALLDWTRGAGSQSGAAGGFSVIRLGEGCGEPRGFAVDGHDARLFAACADMTLEVLNTATGRQVTTLPIGSGVDEVGYDPVHGYIFAADGAGEGNLTIIRRSFAADTYSIIQNLPTRQRAFVMAVDAQSGGVYLVTDMTGADLSHPGGIGTLRLKPINGSFQVIQIGN
jgi:DNA-binding beta-propeller fold protein YncE